MKESFYFLKAVADNVFIERIGIDFEDFEVGQVFEHRPGRTFTEASCLDYAFHSFDLTPFVTDQVYARRVYGDRVRVLETFILSAMAHTTKTFGKVVANLEMSECKILPVYVGDTLYFESEILSKRASKSRPEQGILSVYSRAKNQHSECVCAYKRTLLVYRKNCGPYAAAGY
ncbi:MaoC family dehydratase [Microbulbifer sp. OS29]|uniref:MaoC family dehydratase n=1 Tax=Microbulbifer okhotskensis TaxID=2926617 RepID=A0A9X2EMQ6_9GAMM|nr:MaoC family dehydratase [Microbulbifer okhotskensis]MCO1334524.1 MaoC family dehydratase [Microbulbifer okhotskensis]